MTNRNENTRPRRKSGENGYMMVAVIFMVALMTLALAAAAPGIRPRIRRDREIETMHRGKQYIRAVQLYYRKFHAYPPNLDALVKTENIRFLRKKYIDPTTGKEDWKAIQFGQNKAPTAMGFFSKPMTGTSIAGIGPGSAAPVAGQDIAGSAETGAPSVSSNQSTPATGSAAGGPGSGVGGGATFGGAGIIGFSPQSPQHSILVYKKKDHYNEWEFVYEPLADQASSSTGGAGLSPTPAGPQQQQQQQLPQQQ